MKWLKRTRKDKPSPHQTKERTILRFLFIPKCIKGEWRWLEFAYIYQVYTITDSCDMGWINIRWIDEPKGEEEEAVELLKDKQGKSHSALTAPDPITLLDKHNDELMQMADAHDHGEI
jgi:hypothetical protein